MRSPGRKGNAENAGPATGIYRGRILHHRFGPRRHRFSYPVFTCCLDLDDIARLDRTLRLFGHNRFALFSLRDRDHLGEPGRALKDNVLAFLRERGFAGSVDKVYMVGQLRVLGHVFNPVTFYWCYAEGRPVAHVAEINNTFRQRHCYAFFGREDGAYRTAKVFYVSPFVEMDLEYRFRFAPLGPRLAVFVDDYRGREPVIKTHITGERRPLDDGNLLLSFLRLPFMSAWILAWIHWEALKLWIKRVPLVLRPLDGMKHGWKAHA